MTVSPSTANVKPRDAGLKREDGKGRYGDFAPYRPWLGVVSGVVGLCAEVSLRQAWAWGRGGVRRQRALGGRGLRAASAPCFPSRDFRVVELIFQAEGM